MQSIRRPGAGFHSNILMGGADSAEAVKPFEWSEAELNISSDRTGRESGLSYHLVDEIISFLEADRLFALKHVVPASLYSTVHPHAVWI